jgi:hypothetical protein
MSPRDVEQTLGRPLTDAAFRRCCFQDPAQACLVLGVQAAPHELEALLRVSRRLSTDFAAARRPDLPAPYPRPR